MTAMDYLSSMDDVAEIEAALKSRLGERKQASVIFGFDLLKWFEIKSFCISKFQ